MKSVSTHGIQAPVTELSLSSAILLSLIHIYIRYEITQMLKDVKNGIATHTVVDGRDTYTYQYTVAEDITGLADEGITPVAHTFKIAVTAVSYTHLSQMAG